MNAVARGRYKDVAQSTILLLGTEMVCRGLAFVSFILIARSLGVEALGQYSFVFAYLSFFDVMASLGMNAIFVREISGHPPQAGQIFKNALMVRTACATLAVLAAMLLSVIMPFSGVVKGMVFLGALGLFSSYRPLAEGVFRVHLRMMLPCATSIGKSLLFLSLALIGIWLGRGVLWFVGASVMANLAGAAVLTWMAARLLRPDGLLEWRWVRALLWESAPMMLSGVLTILYIRVDIMLLTFLAGFESVGLYSTATKLAEVLAIVPAALMSTLFPILTDYASRDRERFKEILSTGFKYLLAFILPVAVTLSVCAVSIVQGFFSAKYSAASPGFSVLVWASVLSYPNVIMVNAIIALRKQLWDTWFSLGSLIVNIVLNLWWIPTYGFIGCAWATVAAEAVQFVCLAAYLSRVQGIALPWSEALRLMILGCVTFFLAVIVSAILPWPLAMVAALAAYFPLLFLFRILSPAEGRFLWGSLGFSR